MPLNIFFYLPPPLGQGHELLKAVTPFAAGGRLEVSHDLSGLASGIRKPKEPFSVAIIWGPTQEDLRQIAAMRNLLSGVRTLLVLPDEERETVTLAHRIRPAYISYVDDRISEIVAVLERLTGRRGDLPAAGTPN